MLGRAPAAATSDVVCFMDCDGSFRGDDLLEVADPVLDGRFDLVLGRRQGTAGWPLACPSGQPRARVRAAAADRVSLSPTSDRCGRRDGDALLELGMTDRRSGWPLEMVLRGAKAGWRIEERPVQYAPRIGRSKVTGTLAGTVQAVHDMAGVLR